MGSRIIFLQRAFLAQPTLPLRAAVTRTSLRYTSSDTRHPNPQREAQEDRQKMDTQSNEYSKSGTDVASAAQGKAAFDPNSPNDPDDVRQEAGKGNEVNPLDASPANPALSSGTSEVSGGVKKKGSEGGGGRQGGGDESGNKTAGSSV